MDSDNAAPAGSLLLKEKSSEECQLSLCISSCPGRRKIRYMILRVPGALGAADISDA